MKTIWDSLSICKKATDEYLYAELPATNASAPQSAINVKGIKAATTSRTFLRLLLVPTIKWIVGNNVGHMQSMQADIKMEFDMCNVVKMVAYGKRPSCIRNLLKRIIPADRVIYMPASSNVLKTADSVVVRRLLPPSAATLFASGVVSFAWFARSFIPHLPQTTHLGME
mmetsp:Transcript_3010/g.7709  ORF Transcript_3010/g.7709 Transcript_3010/m.7709 type:complete len:169 (-) Transcript_3010:8-514(-)